MQHLFIKQSNKNTTYIYIYIISLKTFSVISNELLLRYSECNCNDLIYLSINAVIVTTFSDCKFKFYRFIGFYRLRGWFANDYSDKFEIRCNKIRRNKCWRPRPISYFISFLLIDLFIYFMYVRSLDIHVSRVSVVVKVNDQLLFVNQSDE